MPAEKEIEARKLGREPADKEAADEVKRILREVKER